MMLTERNKKREKKKQCSWKIKSFLRTKKSLLRKVIKEKRGRHDKKKKHYSENVSMLKKKKEKPPWRWMMSVS